MSGRLSFLSSQPAEAEISVEHTGEICTQCNQSFVSKSQLRKHRKKPCGDQSMPSPNAKGLHRNVRDTQLKMSPGIDLLQLSTRPRVPLSPSPSNLEPKVELRTNPGATSTIRQRGHLGEPDFALRNSVHASRGSAARMRPIDEQAIAEREQYYHAYEQGSDHTPSVKDEQKKGYRHRPPLPKPVAIPEPLSEFSRLERDTRMIKSQRDEIIRQFEKDTVAAGDKRRAYDLLTWKEKFRAEHQRLKDECAASALEIERISEARGQERSEYESIIQTLRQELEDLRNLQINHDTMNITTLPSFKTKQSSQESSGTIQDSKFHEETRVDQVNPGGATVNLIGISIGTAAQSQLELLNTIRSFYGLCRDSIKSSVLAQSECGSTGDLHSGTDNTSVPTPNSDLITGKKRRIDGSEHDKSKRDDPNKAAVASKRRKQMVRDLPELACWWYKRDPAKYHECHNYCSRNRDLQGYRRHHFEDHWRWDDVSVNSFEVWNAAKHARCGRSSDTNLDKSILKWQQTYRILWGLSDADETPNPMCDDESHVHNRPQREITRKLPSSKSSDESVSKAESSIVEQCKDENNSTVALLPSPGHDFLDWNPGFLPSIDVETLTCPQEANAFETAWTDRMTIASELVGQASEVLEVQELVKTHLARIKSLIDTCPVRELLTPASNLLSEFERSFEQVVAPPSTISFGGLPSTAVNTGELNNLNCTPSKIEVTWRAPDFSLSTSESDDISGNSPETPSLTQFTSNESGIDFFLEPSLFHSKDKMDPTDNDTEYLDFGSMFSECT